MCAITNRQSDAESTDRTPVVLLFVLASLVYLAYGLVIWVVASNAHLYDNVVLGWLHGFLAPLTILLKPLLGASDATVYAIGYNGSWYDLGFVIGLVMLGWSLVWTKNRLLED